MLRGLICAALLSGAAFAQSTNTDPKFEAADVRVSSHSDTDFFLFMRGPRAHEGRYTIRTATMLDLVRTAYGLDDDDKVQGGPTWLEWDRYDVIAKLPAGATAATEKQMLKALLGERFNLKAHTDTKPMPAYVLSASSHPKLKEHDPSSTEPPGCQGKPRPQNIEPGTIIPIEVACHNLTMGAFAEQIHRMAGGYLQKVVVDTTELKGSYDFDIKWTGRGQLAAAGAEGISIFDAVDKQLGLKLDLGKVPMPVVVVESANETPTPNLPEIAKVLPNAAPPTEFEVADVKPTPADFQEQRFQILPSGQINLQGVTLQLIIQQAWLLFSDDMIVGMPKWLDHDRFDIVAKAPKAALGEGGGGQNGPDLDFDAVFTMLKNLLAERFKMQTHWEERPVNAYTLLAVKPKMKPADPNGRIRCVEGPGPDGKDPRVTNPVLNRLLTCQNMTMARFSSMLMSLASGYIHAPVLDGTGLDGAFDFTLSFSAVGQLQGGRGGRGGDAPPSAVAGGPNAASDPNGALSLLDAVQKQLGLKLETTKRPVKVLVIDHIDEKPTDN
jgi:uncharacterized protein (TIGR03435 family)